MLIYSTPLKNKSLAYIKFNGRQFEVVIRDEADSSVCNEIFKYREYRAADGIIKNTIHPILDVGAHAGFFTLYCRALNQKVKIFALEPERKNLMAFKNHLKINKITGVIPFHEFNGR